MFTVRSLAALTILATPLAGGAQSLTTVSVSASMRFPAFATTTPVLEKIVFPRADRPARGGWSYATNATRVNSDANVPHVVTIVAVSGCGGGEDTEELPSVQWSSDGGHVWHELAYEPAPVGPRESAGRHVAPYQVRYRRRAAAGEGACTMRVAFTALPAS
jgi:hypothetical protein